MKTIVRMAVLLLTTSILSAAANQPPVVNAGADTTLRLGYSYIARGTAVDDSLPNTTLVVGWTLASGPTGGAAFSSPSTARSGVDFLRVGRYTLALSAYDGASTVVDSVNVTVLDSIPFLVLTPQAGAKIASGSSYLVTWQVDPPASVQGMLSTNEGLSYELISGAIGDAFTSWVWDVPDSLPLSGTYILQVRKYFERTKSTRSGAFTLVDKSGVVQGRHEAPAPAWSSHDERFTANGRCLNGGSSRSTGAGNALGVGVSLGVKDVRLRQ